MKHIKKFEEITKVNNDDLPIDKSGKFHFKKPAYKMSWNQSRPTEEGVFFGKSKKWQVIVRDVNTGRLIKISQHLFQNEAQQAYDDYYKNNKKEEKPIKDKEIKKDKDEDDLTGIKRNAYVKYEFKSNPQEKDWVIANFDVPDYKISKEDQNFIDFINNTIGRIKLKQGSKTYIIEYKDIPYKIEGYFINNTKTFYEKDIKYFSHRKSELEKYLPEKEKRIKEINPKIINQKSPITMGKLYNDIVSFVSKINEVLPYKENEYYTGKYNLSYITITKVVKGAVKKTVGIISIDKENVPNTISKFGFGRNINEVNFIIRFDILDKTDPYINTIFNYMINIINDNTNDKIKNIERENKLSVIKFHENEYDYIINNISKLSLDELKLKIQN